MLIQDKIIFEINKKIKVNLILLIIFKKIKN